MAGSTGTPRKIFFKDVDGDLYVLVIAKVRDDKTVTFDLQNADMQHLGVPEAAMKKIMDDAIHNALAGRSASGIQ